MTAVTVATEGNTTTVQAPFHPDFPAAAKKLGGKFNATTKAWTFDARDERMVRDTVRSIYGTDGSDAADTVTVRVYVAEGHTWISGTREALYVGGHQIARAFGRDSGAKLGDDVVLIRGSAGSGGSVKNWNTRVAEGSVIEVRDVPRGVAEKMLAEAEECSDIAAAEVSDASGDRRAALEAERERLLARLAEVDNELQP